MGKITEYLELTNNDLELVMSACQAGQILARELACQNHIDNVEEAERWLGRVARYEALHDKVELILEHRNQPNNKCS